MDIELTTAIEEAAAAVSKADALLITAGAGMGVDSGLPDFRGDKGFWKAYPPFERLGVSFVDMANPGWFARDPELDREAFLAVAALVGPVRLIDNVWLGPDGDADRGVRLPGPSILYGGN